jgi:hypothetical protein
MFFISDNRRNIAINNENIDNKGRNLMKFIPKNSKIPEKKVSENLFDAK